LYNIGMSNKNLNKFFNPESIAIIGATDGVGKVGTVITRNILKLGYKGEVFLVNPNRQELFGKKCYPTIEVIEENVDLAIVVIPACPVADVIKNASKKIKNFIVITAGFSEIGEEGKVREKDLEKIAKDYNLNILGPNCLGFINTSLKLNATFAGGMPKRGNIGFISQSGALAVALMDIFEKEQLGFSSIFSIGNKMQIDESDLIEYLGNDSQTKVIGLYLEGIKNGSRFIEVAKKVSRLKPVVILKAGKSEKTQKAISSHTGALAGSDEITAAVFEKCGVLHSGNLEEFINTIRVFSTINPPEGNSVAIITNAGGGGVLATDAFKDKTLKLVDFSESMKEKLKSILPRESSVENPVDLLGDAHEDRYESVLKVLNNENIDSIICILTPQEQTPVDKITEKIISFAHSTRKTVLANFMGGEKVKPAIIELNKNNIPNLPYPEQAVKVLDDYFKWSNQKLEEIPAETQVDHEKRKKAGEIIQTVKSKNRTILLFQEAKKLLETYGIKIIDTWNYNSGSRVEFPAVAKVDSEKVLHKTDKNGVILNIKNASDLRRAGENLNNAFPGANIIIQPMLGGQTELIVGIKRDAVFGPVVVYGLGGIYTEVFKVVDFFVPSFDFSEALKSLEKSKLKFLFGETRGKKAYDIEEVAKILTQVGLLAQENPEIQELDINPLFIYNDNKEAIAVDIKVII
jgi:acetate---CoA ligase (ADP-forming)